MNEQLVNIEGTDLSIREYNGQRVVTFKDIDKVHHRPDGTAGRSFRANRKHFREAIDYFRRISSEAKTEYGVIAPNGLIVLTERGYLKVIKSFTDDLSWIVQDRLIDAYFMVKSQNSVPVVEEKPVLQFETDWFCINRGRINYVCNCYDITSKEYMHHLLEVIGRTYNFDEARRIYITMTGNYKCKNSEVITYFKQLSDLASVILQKDIDDCANEKTP